MRRKLISYYKFDDPAAVNNAYLMILHIADTPLSSPSPLSSSFSDSEEDDQQQQQQTTAAVCEAFSRALGFCERRTRGSAVWCGCRQAYALLVRLLGCTTTIPACAYHYYRCYYLALPVDNHNSDLDSDDSNNVI